MKKIKLVLGFLILTTTLQAQTTFRLELIAEGNFGSTNGDVFVRNTTVSPATNSTGLYQSANNTSGFNVLQDYVIAGNKAILAEKPNGAGRITIVNYPSMTEIHTFPNAPQTLGVASATKAYACYAQGGVVSLIDLQNNTLTPVTEPNNEISTYSNHMQFAEGFMYLDQGAQLVKIDTVTNTVVAKFNPGVGGIKGITYDNQGKLWVIGGTSINSIDVLNNDTLGTAVNVGVSGVLLRYYNNKLYFWTLSDKKMYQYDITNPPVLPLTSVYTSTLPGASWSFGYGRAFDIDQSTGDFVIASASAFTGPSGFEVVNGSTLSIIESGSIVGCIGANKCVLKTYPAPNGPIPVPDQATLPAVSDECSATLTAPTADNGAVTATTTDPTTYTTQGTFTVTWIFTNANGTISQTQTVTINDAEDPATPVLSNVSGSCSVTPVAPTTTDNCAGTVTGTTTTVFPVTTIGMTTITWTFDDGNGNVITADQHIIVTDSENPVTTPLPTLNIACNDTVTSVPAATDNCTGTITGTTTDPLSYATPGTYTINWVFADGNGNSSNEAQTVIVSCSSAGLEDLNTAFIQIYPNPASDVLTVIISSDLVGSELELINAQGAVVRKIPVTATETTINLSDLQSGLYYVKWNQLLTKVMIGK
ncbi:T9SS type A sorting domain-containing protein [Fluviicola sp.]|uniref:T9SS type A sorting domain-containing protein n=1 Tax=Fluviicola sp. TaxID=1917219 RepID=UPI0026286D0B|nr:T9SS type A sorting domain-containing protein [Fluviicola sp.]